MGGHLLPGKTTSVCNQPPTGQLSLLPSAGWPMNTGQSAVMLRRSEVKVKTVTAHTIHGQMHGQQVNCVIPVTAHAVTEHLP